MIVNFRALTNLDAGSFECLDKYGQGDSKEVPEEADNESLTESEELSIIGEDLVCKIAPKYSPV